MKSYFALLGNLHASILAGVVYNVKADRRKW